MSGVGRFIRKRRAKRAAFMADPAILVLFSHKTLLKANVYDTYTYDV